MKRRLERITERENPASARLDKRSAQSILRIINREDRKVAPAVAKTIPQIARAVGLATEALSQGGRLIYLGAGTSGRLGVLDAAECLPTFSATSVVAVLAGGPKAMLQAVEGCEDNGPLARRDLQRIHLSAKDLLVGLSASGRTPYTLEGMRYARSLGAGTVAITCNPAGPLRRLADVSIVPIVGPEVIAGSSRMKAGTAQKLVLNMLSTATMVRLGHVLSGWMIHVRISNRKLYERAQAILIKATGARPTEARRAIQSSKRNLAAAMLALLRRIQPQEAAQILENAGNPAGVIRAALAERAHTQGRAQKARPRLKPPAKRSIDDYKL